jgi:OmpA-OmpF porin, OOP family
MKLRATPRAAGSLMSAATLWRCLCALCGLCGVFGLTGSALADEPLPAGPVIVSGNVPDEATRAAVLARARELFGADRVVDQLGVSAVAAPPQWLQQVNKLLTPDLRQVRQGQLRVEGPVVEVSGQVTQEAQRQQIVKAMAARLDNPAYVVRDGLRVGFDAQRALDQALANRLVEFEPGSADLTAQGQAVLDELLPVLQQVEGRRIEVVGHTDSDGSREQNLILSQARADSVKAYLVSRGVDGTRILTGGAGPDRPVADNRSSEGRARNRRIEFRVLA